MNNEQEKIIYRWFNKGDNLECWLCGWKGKPKDLGISIAYEAVCPKCGNINFDIKNK